MDRRVVISGLGLITPLGPGVVETWTALYVGKSGISEITRFDASNFDPKIAGEVKLPALKGGASPLRECFAARKGFHLI